MKKGNGQKEPETEEPEKEKLEQETEELAVDQEVPETAEEMKEEAKEEVAEEAAEETATVEEETAAGEEKEAKPKREEREEEEEIVEERTYVVPLGKAWIMPANKRAPRAVRMIKRFITKHMKMEAHKESEVEEEEEEVGKLVISNEVNQRVWARGIEKPPRKIRVRAAKDKEGNVTVYLAEGD